MIVFMWVWFSVLILSCVRLAQNHGQSSAWSDVEFLKEAVQQVIEVRTGVLFVGEFCLLFQM